MLANRMASSVAASGRPGNVRNCDACRRKKTKVCLACPISKQSDGLIRCPSSVIDFLAAPTASLSRVRTGLPVP